MRINMGRATYSHFSIVAHTDDEAVNRLRQLQSEYRDAVDAEDYFNGLMIDMKFHLALAAISQCQIQVRMLQELFDMLLLKYTRNLVLLGIMDSSPQEHGQIFDALIAKDSDKLEKSLSNHLSHVRGHIISGFKKMFVHKRAPMVDLADFL